MQEKADEIVYLISKYLKDELSPEEQGALEQWLSESEANRILLKRFREDDDFIMEEMTQYTNIIDTKGMWQKVMLRMNGEAPVPAKVRPLPWKKYMVAAVLLVAIGACWYFIALRDKDAAPVVQNDQQTIVRAATSTDPASLTLTDGSVIKLQNEEKFSKQQGILTVSKSGNYLKYAMNNVAPITEVLYNTISTGLQDRYEVELPDGSRVWLNKSSTLRFAVSASTLFRQVATTGESYYTVTKDAGKPFIVSVPPSVGKSPGIEMKVLGTRFNVNAYPQEGNRQVTVQEGRVQVAIGGNEKDGSILTDNEQLQINEQGGTQLVRGVDIKSVIAWVDGWLIFEKIGTRDALRRLGRHYGVTIDTSAGKLPDCKHSAMITTGTKIGAVLDELQKDCHALHIKYDSLQKKITVLP